MFYGKLNNRGRDESGDTLIEVLLAVLIIALTTAALLGALITSITSSAEHRSLANLDTVLKSNAEAAKYEIELQPSGAWFVNCAPITAATYGGNPLPLIIPSGYTVQVTAIQYWNTLSKQFDPATVSSSSCLANGNEQSGYQLLTFVGTAPSGVSQTLQVAVRGPA